MRSFNRLTIAALLASAPSTLAAPSASTKSACKEISTSIPDRVFYPLSLQYFSETQKYWSTALRELRPACVVLPESVEEVSATVKTLNRYPDVNFAVKSGGHDPNPGHGSVHEGILIAMRKISGTTYDKETNLVHLRPGGEWNDAIGALDPQGVTVLGGRLGVVGMGGYLLQGGISFLSAQYGLAADSIVEWETVLPNGTIAYINAAKQPDLAVAMRGSGSQFGIVTRFTIEAHPIGQVWGGVRIYDANRADQIYAALHSYTSSGAMDPKSAIILTNLDAVGGITTIVMFYFYDGPTPPTTGAFADFLKIPSILDITKTQKYSELLKANGASADLLQARVSFRTFTIPYIRNRPSMYQEITAKFKEITAPHLNNILHATSQCSCDFQPFPAIIGKESEKRGGNAMGISGSDPDRLLLEFQCSWPFKVDDQKLYAMSRAITEWLETKVPEWLADEPVKNPYLPMLMNDAMGDQNVTGAYKDYSKFKALQEKVDPMGLFDTRAGGYKY